MKDFLKRIQKLFKQKKGFTLIELLVVIGILGVLAAALIATIDPFEQIKKAQDANAKNTTVEFVNASIRYYSTHNFLPWSTAGSGVSGCSSAATLAASNTCLAAYIADGELKDSFTSSNVISKINYMGGENAVTACFNPTSKSQWNDPNTLYDSIGATTAGCPGHSFCYWCSK